MSLYAQYAPKCDLQATREPTRIDLDEIFLGNVLDLHNTSQGHAQSEFVHEQPQTELHTCLALVSQSPQHGSADPDKVGAQSQGLEDVCTVPDTAIDVDGNLSLHGRNDLWEGIDSSESAICDVRVLANLRDSQDNTRGGTLLGKEKKKKNSLSCLPP